jgi:hypothetical protein
LQSRRHGRRCSGLGSFDFFSMLLLTKRHDHSAFSISCCLRKKFTQVALVWRCVSYLRDRRAQYGSVQQGSAKSCLCTKITQVNYTRQHKWKIMVNNTKKGKFGIPSRKIPKSRKCPPVQALSVGSPYTVLSPAAQCQNFSVGSPYTASSSSSRVSWSIRKEQII